jgi:hypothetical protein
VLGREKRIIDVRLIVADGADGADGAALVITNAGIVPRGYWIEATKTVKLDDRVPRASGSTFRIYLGWLSESDDAGLEEGRVSGRSSSGWLAGRLYQPAVRGRLPP